MPSIEIDDVGSIGVVKDVPAHQLPPEAWSLGDNVRCIDDSIGRVDGHTQVFGTPGVAPRFALHLASAAQSYFIYASLAKGYVYDGAAHTDITRAAGGDYTASVAADWNGTIIGGIPIVNSGVDDPQFWALPYSTLTKLAKLTNWPANFKAKVLRAFGPYLLAINLTNGGTNQPHRIRWSHPADPGSVPGSWDITDTTKDAGEIELPDVDSGLLVDGLPLLGRFYAYKEAAIWRMRVIGGSKVMDQDSFSESVGLLCTRAAAVTGDGKKHIFMSQDNMNAHDGNTITPLLDKRMRRTIFNAIDVANYKNSFMYIEPLRDEAHFCYPESGSAQPTRQLILNYKTGQITEADCDFQSATVGNILNSDTETWASATGGWDTDAAPWSTANRRKVLLSNPTSTKFFLGDSGTTRDTVAFTGTVQRTGLSVVGRKRTGEWIEDFQQRKLVTRIWPKISGGAVSIRVGASDVVDGPVTWDAAQAFDYTTQNYVDVTASGAGIALEISGATPWKLHGYKMEMNLLGNF